MLTGLQINHTADFMSGCVHHAKPVLKDSFRLKCTTPVV